ncbi:MAG: hypothetical protein R3C68_05630 [Myxococcota bacterium]
MERAITQRAKKRHVTKTAVVLDALNEAFDLKEKSPPAIRRPIREFFGKMSLEDYEEFKKTTMDFSALDREMWR